MLKIEDLKEGEIYTTLNNFGRFSLIQCAKSGTRVYKYFICDGTFNENRTWSGGSIDNNLKLATLQQKRHFENCVKAGKFIPLSEIEENQLNLIEIW